MNIQKVRDKIGVETCEEMDGMSEETLKVTIVTAERAMSDCKRDLNLNPQYLETKENLKALTQGKREVDARQKAKIAYAIHRLEELGK